FGMFEGEFTHEGELCTFEVLLQRFGIEDEALVRIGEIVHDIDLKDGKFNHPETSGLDHLIAGIAMRQKDEEGGWDEGLAAGENAFRLHAAGPSLSPGVLAVRAPDGGFHIKAAGLDFGRLYF